MQTTMKHFKTIFKAIRAFYQKLRTFMALNPVKHKFFQNYSSFAHLEIYKVQEHTSLDFDQIS